jgi:carboxyl-terminal processing protease
VASPDPTLVDVWAVEWPPPRENLTIRRLILTTLSCCAAVLAAAAPARAELRCEMLPELRNAYLQLHVRDHRMTDEISLRTGESLLEHFDPSRQLFLESEAAAVRKRVAGGFDAMAKGDCSLLDELHRDILARHRRTAEFVREVVQAPDYAVDGNARIVANPEDRGFPKTAAERDQLIRNLVHFQMSDYLTGDTSLVDGKRLLVERYERRTRRFQEVETQELYSILLDSFATSLDPHSSYFSEDVNEDFKIHMSLSLEGIGVALSERDGYAVAEQIIPDGATWKYNMGACSTETDLRPKDKILRVRPKLDDSAVDVVEMPLRKVVSLIRGKKGTKVGLTVLRSSEKSFDITIERDAIDLAEQAAKLRFEEVESGGVKLKLALLSLPSFYGNDGRSKRQSTIDVAALLDKVKREKADGLLLDLSLNGGGLLDHAVKISGYFIREGDVVGVRDGRGNGQTLADTDPALLYSGPLVVHTSRVSASASEIVAGALKDYHRAVITGDGHTFGKGSVQTVSEVPEAGAIKVTTAMFFRPGGRSTQKSGVETDVEIPSLFARDDFGEAAQKNALPEQRVAPFLSFAANSSDPAKRWTPVDEKIVAQLVERSKQRVAQNKDFDEVREKLAEMEKREGVIGLAQEMQERAEAEAKEKKKEAEGERPSACDFANTSHDEHEELGPQVREALRVLADWVVLQQSASSGVQAAANPAQPS